MAGIKVEGENKWLTLIQNAASYPTKLNNGEKQNEPTETLQNPRQRVFV
jgi:hypothetical protein